MRIILKDKNNHIGQNDFEGYSADDMVLIMYQLFGENCKIKLQRLMDTEYKKIPLLNQIQYIIKLIGEKGSLKLTAKGYFPTKIVAAIYHQGFLKDYLIEAGISKLHLEKDVQVINLARNLLEMSGIVKKRHSYLSLTKKGEAIQYDTHAVLMAILDTFFNKFNWGYYDGYESEEAGQLGIGFTLILLSKYGRKRRPAKFYADKYYKAFPFLLDEFCDSPYRSRQQSAVRCYSVRTFERCLDYLGLINLEDVHDLRTQMQIKKNELFDKLIKVFP